MVKIDSVLVVEYTGEYGIEVATFVPFIHYLKKTGMVGLKVLTYRGMRPYYYFLDDDDIDFKEKRRIWIHPSIRVFFPPHLRNDDDLFRIKQSKPAFFEPPLFYEHYKQFPELFPGKRLILIQNKYNSEWGGPPVNFMDTALLDSMLKIINKEYKIIYLRTNELRIKEYSDDDNEAMSFKLDDKDMIQTKYNNVILIEDLLNQQPYDFNTLKCILHSQATATISTIGGFNFFSAYFPCKHIIYKVDTPPTYCKEFYQNQHDMLRDGRETNEITFITDKQCLLEEISDKFADPPSLPLS